MTLTDDEKAAIERVRAGRLLDDATAYMSDVRDLLDALGLGTHARDASPHEVMRREVLPVLRYLATALRDPDEATVEAVGVAIAATFAVTNERRWRDTAARAAIAALADHLLGGEGE